MVLTATENHHQAYHRDEDRVYDKAVEKICQFQHDNNCGFLLMDNHGTKANKMRYMSLMQILDVRYIPYAWSQPRSDVKKRDKSEGFTATYDRPGLTQSGIFTNVTEIANTLDTLSRTTQRKGLQKILPESFLCALSKDDLLIDIPDLNNDI